MSNASSTHGSCTSSPTSAFRREKAGLQIAVLLSEHGMSALEKSEELSRLLDDAAWIPITLLMCGHQPSET